MKLTGQRQILLPLQAVWDALNDPNILARAIPGCESLERSGPDEFQMTMVTAVGPVRAKFKAKLTMQDVVPPRSYVLAFSGNGGAAGFGNGTARVALSERDGGTRMDYEAAAQVGGKVAQVGARLIQGVSERLAEQFFDRFIVEVGKAQTTPETTAPAQTSGTESKAEASPEPIATVGQCSAPPPSTGNSLNVAELTESLRRQWLLTGVAIGFVVAALAFWLGRA